MRLYFQSNLVNVILLGIAFLFVFAAFQTSSMIEQVVLDSASREPNSTFQGSGYYSLAIIYFSFAVANWGAPFIVVLIGCRLTLFISSAVYALFIASFIKPITWTLYLGSVLVGAAAAFLWTAQGNYISDLSQKSNIGLHSGIFWSLFQGSMFFGNIYQYFAFRGESDISSNTRMKFYAVMTVCASLGVILFLFLKNSSNNVTKEENEQSVVNETNSLSLNEDDDTNVGKACNAFKHSFELILRKEMLFLLLTFFYSGIELTFYSGVYGTCIGHTQQFGESAKGYIGLNGIMIGLGEISGAIMFSYFSKDGNVVGRRGVVTLGFITHVVAMGLIFLSFGSDSPIVDTNVTAYIQPSLAVALFCGFLLGYGDSAFNTQIIAILGYMYSGPSSPSAFAIFKFTQSLAAAIAFFYSSYVLLPYQLLILIIFGFIGTLAFLYVDRTNDTEPNVTIVSY